MIKQIKYQRSVDKLTEMLHSLSRMRDMNETIYWYEEIEVIPLFYLSSKNQLTIRMDHFINTKKDFGLSGYEIAIIINKLIIGDEDCVITVLDDTNTFFKVQNNKFIQCYEE